MTDRERLIGLNVVPGVEPIHVRRLLEAFGSVEVLWHADARAIAAVDGIGPARGRRIAAARHDMREAARELAQAAEAGLSIVTWGEPEYPAPLKQIADPPPAIYRKGAWVPADAAAVAIVGSRNASAYGRQMAERLAYDLAVRGLTVVSGLARGIDAAAHRGALKAGGRTIAVLGSGFGRLYPPEHAALAAQIGERGAVLSEFPMQMEPFKANFPRRNRLVSGLSWGVVVVEASDTSGALITADCALEQGREVFAVPGHADSTTSHGAHRLLRQGARLVTSVEDILEELNIQTPAPDRTPAVAQASPGQLGKEERAVWAQLRLHEPADLDAVALHSGLPAGACAATLLGLELKRLVTQLPGQRYVRR